MWVAGPDLGRSKTSLPPQIERALLPRHTTSKQGKMNFIREVSHQKNTTKTHLSQLNVYDKHCMEVLTNM